MNIESQEPPHDDRLLWQKTAAWIVLAVAWRALLAVLVPVMPDEAYYWDWSRHLAAGYYDHPPAIAFMIAAGRTLFGDTLAGIRIGPAAAAFATQTGMVWLAARLGGAPAALRAAILTTALPLATLGLVIATPDAPLFAVAPFAAVAVDKALEFEPRSWRSTKWWLIAGVLLGLAFTSKYTAVLLPASLFAACVVYRPLRARLLEPGPYLAFAAALLVFSPVLIWNAQHDWISLRFQLGHGFSGNAESSVLIRELTLFGGQLGLASPIISLLLIANAIVVLRDGWRERSLTAPSTPAGARIFTLGAIACITYLFFAFSALRRAPEPNWPALMYVGAIPLLAISTSTFSRGAWWRSGIVLAFALLLLATIQAWRPVLPLTPPRDPIARAYGWEDLARAVDRARADPFLANAPSIWVAAERYQETAELGYHLPQHPTVFSLNLNGRKNQYDLWMTISKYLQRGDGVVAVLNADSAGEERARIMSTWFSEAKQGELVQLKRGDGVVGSRRIWIFRDARYQPVIAP